MIVPSQMFLEIQGRQLLVARIAQDRTISCVVPETEITASMGKCSQFLRIQYIITYYNRKLFKAEKRN
jgi:hypothetical protein